MKKSIAVHLFLLLALMVFFGPAVFGGRALLPTDVIFESDPLWQPMAAENYTGPSNPILTDQVYQFFPWKLFKLELITKGELPLWNPYICAGMPFIGNAQSAVFDPFNILGYLLPSQVSLIFSAIARLFVAGFFTFLFARKIGLKIPGATLAMITFVFSGPLIVWVGYPHYAAIVWLPAILYTTEKVLTTDRPVNFALGSIAIGMQFLAGHPELSFQIMATWVCYALWRAHYLHSREPATWGRLVAMCHLTGDNVPVVFTQNVPGIYTQDVPGVDLPGGASILPIKSSADREGACQAGEKRVWTFVNCYAICKVRPAIGA